MKTIIRLLIRYVPRKYLQLVSAQGLQIVKLFYKGNNVECPICGHTFRKILPYGRIKSRDNALCPNCQSLERHRLLWLYLKENTGLFTLPSKMLHIAPEVCFMERFEKVESLDYITGDIESPLAKVKMDIHAIPFEQNTFDSVMCNHVMEHVDVDILAMKEIYRVLKPGGWAIIQIPFFNPVPETTFEDNSITNPKEREVAFGQDDHVRLYGKDYAQRLKSAGFEVVQNEYAKTLDPHLVTRYALPPEEVIYFCNK